MGHASTTGWRISAAFFVFAVLILVVAILAVRIKNFDLSSSLLGVALPTLCVALFVLYRFLSTAREHERHAVGVLGRQKLLSWRARNASVKWPTTFRRFSG
jgi:hypothetical protein